ncbi:MAG: dihydrofolate reductase [Thermoleophilia bacterium]|nr:dihydrofolate reductase [Thermoleophilia bacterium]
MSAVRVAAFSVSLDGYAAGPGQSLDQPLGAGAMAVHEWMLASRSWRASHGQEGGVTGPDDDLAERAMENLGAWIMGRNMFGPVRGPWPDHSWRGWWGEEPPYHCPVFVLTHHARPPLEMAGGTTFHFVTDGIHAAMERARDAAGDADIRIGGGAETIREYLEAGLIDEMHLAIAPVLLGSGEHLLRGLSLPELGWRVAEHLPTAAATHVVLRRGS